MLIVLVAYTVLLVLSQLFLPWWSLAVIAFAAGWLLFNTKADSMHTHWMRKLSPALGLALVSGLVWLVPAIYIHITRNSQLTERMGDMLGVGSVSLVFVLTFILPFVVAFLSALTGTLAGTCWAGKQQQKSQAI